MGILVYLNWVFKLYRLVGESRMIVVVTHRKIYINFGKLRLHHTVTHAKKTVVLLRDQPRTKCVKD